MSNCDLCGKDFELFKTRIEGSLVDACERCSKFGEVLWRIEDIKSEIKTKKIDDEDWENIVEDYDKIIRKEREKIGLKQDELAKKLNEKESLIQKIENKQIMPNLKIAKKMEKFFGVKLIENISDNKKIEIKKIEVKSFTLGDVIKQKRTG